MKEEKNKIILIYPRREVKGKSHFFPLSILSLAGPLIENGFSPVLIDLGTEGNWKNIIDNNIGRTVFVGISTMTGLGIKIGLEVAVYIREKMPRMPIVWGGVHPTILPEQTLKNQFVDIIVRGEGEGTIVELARSLQQGTDVDNIRGISYKEDGRVIHNENRDFLDLETLPMVPYNLIDMDNYDISSSTSRFSYQSARGCPHRCAFCDVVAFNRGSFRAKSVEKTIMELSEIVKKYNPARIEFVDDNFFVNKNRVELLCREILKRELKFKWVASCRADYFSKFDLDFLKLVKSAGCSSIYVGAESGSQRILDYIKKGIKVEDIITAAEKLSEVGIPMSCAFMSGFPGETKGDIGRTIELIEKLRQIGSPDQINIDGILIYAPYPATPMYETAVGLGFKPPESFEKWAYFRHNQKNNIVWHSRSYRNYLHVIAQLSINLGNTSDLRTCFKDLFSGNIRKFIWEVLHLSYKYRWEHNFYFFPIELDIVYFIDKYYSGGMEV